MDIENSIEKQVWAEHYAEVEELARELWDLGNKLAETNSSEFPHAFIGYVYGTVIPELKNRCGEDVDLTKYAAYHALIGSTTDYVNSPNVDLPNNEIGEVIEAELEKIKNQKK